jgi:hypothetical protein
VTTGSVGYALNDIFMTGSGTKTGTNGRSFEDKLLNTVVEDNDYLNLWLLQDYKSYNFSIRANSAMLADALKYDQRSSAGGNIDWY